MNNVGTTVALIAIAISLIGMGFSFFVYVNLSSDIRAMEKSNLESDLEIKSQLHKVGKSLDESSSRQVQLQEDLAGLREMNEGIVANQTLLQERIISMQQYVAALEDRVLALNGNQQPSHVGNINPVAQWNFDIAGDTGRDSSGNGNDMKLLNGLTAVQGQPTCKSGGCLNFDGTDDYALVDRSILLEPSYAITVSAWVYPESTNTIAILDKAYVSHTSPFYSYSVQFERHADTPPDKMRLILCLSTAGSSSCLGQDTSEILVDLNLWQFVTMTYDGSELRGYVNGKMASSLPKTGTIEYYDTPLTLGKYTNLSNTPQSDLPVQVPFRGYLDELRIYDRPLSQSEVWALYTNSE